MRVVVHDYVGYAFPAQLARALARRGHDVLFLHCSSFVAGKGLVEPKEGDPETLAFDSVGVAGSFAKYDVRRRVAHERETGRDEDAEERLVDGDEEDEAEIGREHGRGERDGDPPTPRREHLELRPDLLRHGPHPTML